jgi:methyltransferase of ATP-grasp peptide maturase system
MTDTESPGEVRALLRALTQELEEEGSLRSPEWRAAVQAVPRHVFLPEFFQDAPGPDGITRYTPVSARANPEEWLTLAYQNKTWVTQLDNGATTPDGAPAPGTPTSSSTLPGVVVRMLEDLDVPDAAHVLEVGTGTGYSTGLLCARLGDEYVTSVEHDADLSRLARTRLASLGYAPELVNGDGAQGWADGAPYERIIATYSPPSIPAAWLGQAARGGALILASVVGGLGAYGYVKVHVESPEEGRGRFIDSAVSFMPSREAARPEVGPLFRPALDERQGVRGVRSTLLPDVLTEQSLMWAIQLRLPRVLTLSLNPDDGRPGRWFLHPDGSWAVLESDGEGTAYAYQGGPRDLWNVIESTASQWLADGRPALHRYGLTVTPDQNTVWLDMPTRPVGTLGA